MAMLPKGLIMEQRNATMEVAWQLANISAKTTLASTKRTSKA